jgi:hypothetical protein
MRISATTPKFPPPPRSPEQILFVARLCGDDTAVRQNNVCSDQIVERKAKAADQRSIAAAQSEPGHADRAARTRHGGKPKRIGYSQHIGGAGTARDARAAPVGADVHIPHAAEIEHKPVAQGAAGPVVSTAAHRQRETGGTRGGDGELDVGDSAAMNNQARHGANRLGPDRRRSGVTVVAWPRRATGELSAKSSQYAFDQISHCLPRSSVSYG